MQNLGYIISVFKPVKVRFGYRVTWCEIPRDGKNILRKKHFFNLKVAEFFAAGLKKIIKREVYNIVRTEVYTSAYGVFVTPDDVDTKNPKTNMHRPLSETNGDAATILRNVESRMGTKFEMPDVFDISNGRVSQVPFESTLQTPKDIYKFVLDQVNQR